MKRYCAFILFGLLLFPTVMFAGNKTDTTGIPPVGLLSAPSRTASPEIFGNDFDQVNKPKKNWFKAMRYSGYTRFYPLYRNMQQYYNIAPANGLTLPKSLTADDGFRQPMMVLRLEANPSAKTWFQTELQFNHHLLRTINITNNQGRHAGVFVIFQLQGAVDTKIGHLKMIAGGGVNWYRLSPSTLWGYQYRDDMFERYPWEPEGNDFARYNSFYSSGDIPRDQRFGMQGTQGFILEATNMPAGFDAAILYGKTSASAAFQSFVTKDPINMLGGRVGKQLGDHKIGYNYFSQMGYHDNKVAYKKIYEGIDSFYVEDNHVKQIITTVDGRFNFEKFSIFTEFGAGTYTNNIYNAGLKDGAQPGLGNVGRYKSEWNTTAFFEITTKRQLTFLPLKLSIYRIEKTIGSNTSSIANTSVEQDKPSQDTPDQYYINYYDGLITEVGQLANNRQGINLVTTKEFFYKKIKTKLSMGIAQEIENLAGDTRNGARANYVAGAGADSLTKVPFSNSITYEHKLNGLSSSRFAFFQRFAGPYGRLHSIFRRSFDNIAITDSIINYKKSFNTIDFEVKYKFRLFGKEIIVSNFIDYSSVQDKWSPIPVFSNKAFLRYFYEEFMVFYNIHSKVTLVGFLGLERVRGNSRTELADADGNLIKNDDGRPVADANGKPIDQTGHGYGLGIDYDFSSRATVHLRSRWFDHSDKNFLLDKYKGHEMTFELKVFF